MYNPVFPLVTAYSYAEAVEKNHSEWLLRWPNGTLWQWNAHNAAANGGSVGGWTCSEGYVVLRSVAIGHLRKGIEQTNV